MILGEPWRRQLLELAEALERPPDPLAGLTMRELIDLYAEIFELKHPGQDCSWLYRGVEKIAADSGRSLDEPWDSEPVEVREGLARAVWPYRSRRDT